MKRIRKLLLSFLITFITWAFAALVIWLVFTNEIGLSYSDTLLGVGSFNVLYTVSKILYESVIP